jgi:hypothetical protein
MADFYREFAAGSAAAIFGSVPALCCELGVVYSSNLSCIHISPFAKRSFGLTR